jgi:hypothetical protein
MCVKNVLLKRPRFRFAQTRTRKIYEANNIDVLLEDIQQFYPVFLIKFVIKHIRP